MTYKKCIIKNCNKPTRSMTCCWCEMHYYRNRRNGDPEVVKQKNYSLNEDFFNEISENSAWLLGLMWADGWVSKKGHSVGITSKDLEMLRTAESLLGGKNLVVERSNPMKHWVLRFSSAKIKTRLEEYGLHASKSFSISWPKIEEKYGWHFLRGVLDGDGCVAVSSRKKCIKTRCSIQWNTASQKFSDEIIAFMTKQDMKPSLQKTHKNDKCYYKISLNSVAGMIAAYKNLYPEEFENLPRLERKKSKLDSWAKQYIKGEK